MSPLLEYLKPVKTPGAAKYQLITFNVQTEPDV